MVLFCSSRCSLLKMVLVALYMLCFLIFISESAPTYLYHACDNSTTYTPNSTYQANLNSLLSTLSSTNITRNNLFYNATGGNTAPNSAYGLYMCRGDLSNDTCHDCVETATRDITQRCPRERQAVVWYDECMLRYNDESIFSTMDTSPGVFLINTGNETQSDRLSQVLGTTMNQLAARASSDQSANGGRLRGFATGEANFTSFQTLYNLVQCTPDLSGTDCNRCFREAIAQLPGCCTGRPGGRVLFPSCSIRYEMYPFYNSTAAPPPPWASMYVSHHCDNSTTYTPNSTYQANLNSLLSTLSSTNITRNNLFFNATGGNTAPNRAYGLYLCRGDVSRDTCHYCVETATRDITQRCPRARQAVVWYNECMLRYDNTSFFSTMDEEPRALMWTVGNVTEHDRLKQVLGTAMDDLATRAASNIQSAPDGKLKGFATNETSVTRFQTLYSLAQCTPDLSEVDCKWCFRVVIGLLTTCCIGVQGGRVLLPSCNIRFEVYPFYNSTVAPPPTSPTSTLPPSPASRSSPNPGGNGKISAKVIIPIVIAVVVSVLLFTLGFCFLRRRAKKYDAIDETTDDNEILIAESLQYDLSTIGAATNNFSAENKIGEGGFGNVFKGTLSNGQEIAVKRLSKRSGQGAQEFKNEVVVVAKLQHRNLVRLVGFCLEQEEKILVYEFVPNKSLDYFLFDSKKRQLLDWSLRYKIIAGIAQGILYLHEHSRLKIIHRDLKASNVLLDGDMNPKISDFGMARIFGIDQSQANTSRIVGTFGYMAPEYAMHGEFSAKSDVFSFGVLILEIISGKKNNSFYQSGGSEDLLSYAWKRWKDGTPLDLVDQTLGDSIIGNEAIRCIHIGLLCVQEDPDERPTMTTVVLMLNSYSFPLPLPHQPAFFVRRRTEATLKQLELDSKSTRSANEVSISELHPR